MASSGNYSMKQNNRRYAAQYYSQGTAAYELQPEKIRRAKKEYTDEHESIVEARVKARVHEKREFTTVQLVTICASVACVLLIGAFFIKEMVALRDSRKSVASLQTGYQTILHDNAMAENRLANSVDLAYIYEEATERLGMSLPEKHQIVVYGKASSEYVEKNAEIPHD